MPFFVRWFRFVGIVAIIFGLVPPMHTAAANLTHPVISEVQTASESSANQEFIEIYNPSNLSINLDGWKVEYKSATGTSWTNPKINLSGSLQPRGYYLLSSNNYIAGADAYFSPGLAAGGGHVRILNDVGVEVDILGWGNANSPEGTASGSPPAGQSVQRKFGQDGKIIDTNNNAADFSINITPSPETTPVPVESNPDPSPEPSPDPSYGPVDVTELLIDPVAPQTDATDEFVELHNSNLEPLDISGYVIKTGSNLQYSYTVPAKILEPAEYAVFYAKDTSLTLPNSGGKVQVLDPNGEVVSELVTYENAEPGESWALIDDIWQWTALPTPAADNVLAGGKGADTATSSSPLANLVINELLVNPSSPQSDANDEFVEIYNPNPFSVELSDYQLQTGSGFKTHHTLPSSSLGSGQFAVFYSRDSNISLSNSGGSAQLVDSGGNVISSATSYEESEEGDAWAKFDGGWAWTGSPTPGTANVMSESVKNAKKAKVKAAATKKVTAKAPKKATAKKAKAKKAKDTLLSPATVPVSPVSAALVAASAMVALVYGVYEFRYDIRNKFVLASRHFKNRWHSGP